MEIQKDYDYKINILLVGDYRVGKSSLSLRYFEDKFQDSYISTIGVDFKLKTIEMNEKIFKFLVWDYQPAERFWEMPSNYYRGAHGIMILYDTTNQQSFDNIKKWIKQIQNYAKNDVNIILIGTKIDLVSQKVIDTETGKKLAEQLGYSFFETSSKENINVNEAFETFFKQTGTRVVQTNSNQNSNTISNSISISNQKDKKEFGNYGVGKTSLLTRYTDGNFTNSYNSTIGFDFWDPTGAERFLTITRSYYRGTSGVILFYDVTDQQSFNDLKDWIKEIQDKADDNVNIMLIGTKSDLVSQKVIDTETGKNFAEQLGYSFFETSSKENINVDEAFESLTNQIYQRVKQIPQEKSNQIKKEKDDEKKGCLLF
ncbi:gtp-binding protein yptm2 [Anaeramoeba ignava]|uniref:Gtp-binding protein yptm2 n=1 Tax=Anaeramoeba ignava TaxID=1746090 RepID=A0A9Q0R9J2_ANAIG|nr:gtp-binding protein yptm2 [Anaeramoeba ignava]